VKLNHEKRIFGLAFEKFLGYLITQQGIEANPYQIFAILNMKSPAYVKGGPDAEWTSCSAQPIHQPIHKQMQVLQSLKKNKADFH